MEKAKAAHPVAVLCGGLGTRMLPATVALPKALIPVHGEPFLYHLLRLLERKGFTRVVLCVGHLGEKIEEAVGDGSRFGLQVSYSNDGAARAGTAGAVKRALPQLGERFFVLYGDAYLDCDYAGMQDAFARSGADGLMSVYRNRGAFGASNVLFRGGAIQRYDKAASDVLFEHIDYGVEMFRARAFAAVRDGVATDLAEVLQRLIAQRALCAFEVTQRFYEMGSPEGYADTAEFLRVSML